MSRKKRRTILYISNVIISVILIALTIFVILNITKDKIIKKVDFEEKGNIKTSVCINSNDFIKEKCIKDNQKIVADLINNIDVNFDYDLSLSETGNFEYNYQIKAITTAVEENGKEPIFEKEEILDSNNSVYNNHESFNIDKSVKVDYNKYSKLIGDFINNYDLVKLNSNLEILLEVNVIAKVEDMPKTVSRTYTSSVIIPLATNTVELSYVNNNYDYTNSIYKYRDSNKYDFMAALTDIIFKVDIVHIILIILFIIKIKPKKKKFDKIVDNIVRKYDKDIVESDLIPKFNNLKEIRIKKISELIDAKNALNRPIMHFKKKGYSLFYITTSDEVYYFEIDENNL